MVTCVTLMLGCPVDSVTLPTPWRLEKPKITHSAPRDPDKVQEAKLEIHSIGANNKRKTLPQRMKQAIIR